jgi:hypothetical protein
MIKARPLSVFACLACLLLANCYESQELLLNAADARQPLTHQDWQHGSGDSIYHAELTPRPDGWYDYAFAPVRADGSEGAWEHHKLLLNDLQSVGGERLYIFGIWDNVQQAYIYGVVTVSPDGSWRAVAPSCSARSTDEWYKSDIAAAVSAGGMHSQGDDVCTFKSRGALFEAMRKVIANPGFRNREIAARNPHKLASHALRRAMTAQ